MTLPSWLQKPFDFTKELIQNFGQDDAFTRGAALAYYTVFSFAPMLVVIIAVTSIFVGRQAIQGKLYEQLSGLLGPDASEGLQNIVGNAYQTGESFFATLISLGTLLFAATTIFNALKTSLNGIWEIQYQPDNSIKGFLFDRVLSFGMVLVLGFMLLITLVVNAVVTGFVEEIAQYIGIIGPGLLQLSTLLVDLCLTAIIFACLFRFLPDARARWRDIWVGAFFTSLLFLLGKFLIGLYLGNSNFSNTYGAAAALITLLVWTYYNSQIIFLGAEFTFVWAKWQGHPILPSQKAVKVIREVKKLEPRDAATRAGVSSEQLKSR